MKIGFLGTGTIAVAMVRGIADDGHEIWVSERNHEKATALTAAFDNVHATDNQTVVDNTDVVIVCLMANVARDILGQLTFRPDQLVFSVMVPFPLADVADAVQPAAVGSVFIPYPHIAQGNSPLLVYPAHETLIELFGSSNTLIPLQNEGALHAYLAAQAILLPSVKLLHETTHWLTAQTGDSAAAEQFIRGLVGSYLLSRPLDQTALQEMLIDLGTEGGMNAQLRDRFITHGTYKMLPNGFENLLSQLKAA